MSESVEMVRALGGELVTYYPHGGVPKTFRALVYRAPSQVQQGGTFQYAVNVLNVMFPRDSVDGVTVVQPRKDRMSFKRVISDVDATMFSVQKIVEEDAGMTPADGGMFNVQVTA